MSMTKLPPLRSPAGLFALAHPGPAAACTALTVMAGWSTATRDSPARSRLPGKLLRAAAAMFLAQISTGSLNDFVDRQADSVHQTYKPIPRQQVSPAGALAFALTTGIAALAVARGCGRSTLVVMSGGLASGWAYDLGLSRTPMSWVPFVSGIMTVPWVGAKAVGARVARPLWMTLIAGVLGFGLHLANAGPDIERDRLAGRRSLPVLLGPRLTRDGTHLALTAGSVLVVATTGGRSRRLAVLGATGCLGLLAWDRHSNRPGRGPGRHPFVLPVLAAGILSAGWLAGAAATS